MKNIKYVKFHSISKKILLFLQSSTLFTRYFWQGRENDVGHVRGGGSLSTLLATHPRTQKV